MSDSLPLHEQQARPPCPSPTPGVYSNSCPSSRWCHPTISSSVIPFSSHLQSFPASGSFQMSQLFASGGQSIGVSASTSVLPMNIQDWFPSGWTGWISWQSKGLSRVFSNTTVQIYLGWNFLFRIAWIPMNTWRCSNGEKSQHGKPKSCRRTSKWCWGKTWGSVSCKEAPASGKVVMDFPGAPVVETPWFQCRGHQFDPRLGKIPHADWCSQNVKEKKKKEKKEERKQKVVRGLGNILAWSSELLGVCACWKSRPPALTPVITSHCWITICFAFSLSRRTSTAKISEQGRYCKSQKLVTPKWEEIGDDRVHLWGGIFVSEVPEMG